MGPGRSRIKLTTPGLRIRLATNWATGPSLFCWYLTIMNSCIYQMFAVFGQKKVILVIKPDHVAQSVTCLQIQSRVRSRPGPILSWRLIMKSFVRPFSYLQLIQESMLSVTSESMCTKYWLTTCLPRKKCGDCPDMSIAVDLDVKHQTKQNK